MSRVKQEIKFYDYATTQTHTRTQFKKYEIHADAKEKRKERCRRNEEIQNALHIYLIKLISMCIRKLKLNHTHSHYLYKYMYML